MARLSANKTRTATMDYGGEEITFIFSEPTPAQHREYLKKRYNLSNPDATGDDLAGARIDLFDLLIKEINPLEAEDGTEITEENIDQYKKQIPIDWKDSVIMHLFDAKLIKVKN